MTQEATAAAGATAPAAGALQEDEGLLRSTDGTALWVRRVRPAGPPKGRLAFVHGFAEHGGRYAETLRWFAARGWQASAVDLRGHGRSGGRRTFVRRFDEYLDDVEVFLRDAAGRPGEAAPGPLVLLGHSMGGLVVARTLEDRLARLPALAGAVLASPFLGVKMQLPAWKVGAARLLSRWLPFFRMPTDLDPDGLSRDPAIGRAYVADPLVSQTATARWYTETVAAQARALADAARLELPLLVWHGDDDPIVDGTVTERFVARAPGAGGRLHHWPGARHEVWNETNRDEVRAFALAWLEGLSAKA